MITENKLKELKAAAYQAATNAIGVPTSSSNDAHEAYFHAALNAAIDAGINAYEDACNANHDDMESAQKLLIKENKIITNKNNELKRLDSAVLASNKDAHDAFKVVSDAAENDDWDAYDAALIIFTEHTVYANAITAIRDVSYSNFEK